MESQFPELYKTLNPEQQKAVDAIEGPVMVLAGPGTGKTQVLAMRIANILVQTQMDPWNILCLTFTESGVVAMRERLLSIIGTPAYHVRIHTFHSFCNDIIQSHPDLFARNRNWQMLSDIERIDLFRSLIDALPGQSPLKPFGDPYLFLNDIAGNIRKLKQEGISPKEFSAVLTTIEKFVQDVTEDVTTFCSVKANLRTDGECDSIAARIEESAKKQGLSIALTDYASSLYMRYQERIAVAENKRQQSSARTAFKNDIKRWIDGLARNILKQQDIARVYKQYEKTLIDMSRYDYEDMIISVIAELQKNSELLAQYQEQFQYMLVDEYQDTNGAQNEVVYLLGSYDESPNIFVVGDDKQSIFRFQGASVNNMLSFYERYQKTVSVISLKHNYRSQPTVLQAADALISHNQALLTKVIPGIEAHLVASSGRSAEMLKVFTLASEDMESYFIVSRIQDLIRQNVPPQEIAVLFRYNRDGTEILRMMNAMGIPARLETGENVLEDITVKQWLTILRYLTNTHRDDLLADIILYPWWKVDTLDGLRVIRYASLQRKSLLEVLASEEELKEARVEKPNVCIAISQLFAKWHADRVNTTLQGFLHDILTESGWLDYVLTVDDQLSALQKMTTLLNKAKELNAAQQNITLEEFIHSLQLLQEHNLALETESWQVSDSAVRLMTAHRAKGLEFEHVFMMRMNDKHWGNNPEPSRVSLPHGLVRYDTIIADENNEDERRLCYVAMTRAKQGLILTRSEHKGNGRETVPSLFIEEIPSEVKDSSVITETQTESVDRIAHAMLKPVPPVDQEKVRDWVRYLLRGYVLSVTHLNNYLKCPREFYVNNLLQIPSARKRHQALGTAVHGALDEFFDECKKAGKVASKEKLLQSFTYYLSRELLIPSERKDIQEEGERLLRGYYDTHHQDFLLDTEGEFDFKQHGVTVEGIPITGKIDKIELLNGEDRASDGTWREGAKVNVVDYKTGDPEKGLKKVKPGGDSFRQLVFYKLLCDNSPQFKFTMVSGEIDFVQPSEKKGYIKKKVEITDSDTKQLISEIKDVWKKIQSLEFMEDGVGCGECDVCAKEVHRTY